MEELLEKNCEIKKLMKFPKEKIVNIYRSTREEIKVKGVSNNRRSVL